MQPTSTQILKINQKQNEKLKGGFNMFKTMKKRIKNEKGLTLIELLAVVVILAIVAAIAIPAIGNIIDSSRVKSAKADAANIVSAANLYFTENSSATTFTQATDGMSSYVSNKGTITNFTVSKSNAGLVIKADGVANSKGYKIGGGNTAGTGVTVQQLNIDSGTPAAGVFAWD